MLIASSSADDRRRVGDIARQAELRVTGFIREAEQVGPRTMLSMPDVLLLCVDLFHRAQALGLRLEQLHSKGRLCVVLFGSGADVRLAAQRNYTGVDGSLELTGSPGQAAEDFVKLVHSCFQHAPATGASLPLSPAPPAPIAPVPCARRTLPPSAVVIGSSTGGPVALMSVLKKLPADFPLPIAVVQHMPPGFTRMLAERLNAECPMHVQEASADMPFQAGSVYIAPGGSHMVLRGTAKTPRLCLTSDLPENSCRPAVDVLFRSSGAVYGGRQHVIVLTGMGRDGLLGAMQLHALGARIVVQDAATSTVWGMPGAVAQAGYADQILPIHDIAPQLLRCL